MTEVRIPVDEGLVAPPLKAARVDPDERPLTNMAPSLEPLELQLLVLVHYQRPGPNGTLVDQQTTRALPQARQPCTGFYGICRSAAVVARGMTLAGGRQIWQPQDPCPIAELLRERGL